MQWAGARSHNCCIIMQEEIYPLVQAAEGEKSLRYYQDLLQETRKECKVENKMVEK
jgi:hypothetical protein